MPPLGDLQLSGRVGQAVWPGEHIARLGRRAQWNDAPHPATSSFKRKVPVVDDNRAEYLFIMSTCIKTIRCIAEWLLAIPVPDPDLQCELIGWAMGLLWLAQGVEWARGA
jgi:hypothetical protein